VTMRKLGVCRSAPPVVPDGDGLGPEVASSVATPAGSLVGNVVGLPVCRSDGSSVVGSRGIEVVGTCEGERVGILVGPAVGIRVVGTCDEKFVGLMVGLIVRPNLTAASAADLVAYVQLFAKVEGRALEILVGPHCPIILS
jgi:hypothetical protein